jgi:excinuclease ABC subunit A
LGNTVVTIEHNLEVIKYSDYIIDLGPEGGEKGGWVVASGTPEEASKIKASYTGQFLRKVLDAAGHRHTELPNTKKEEKE